MRRQNRNEKKANSNTSVYITGGVLILAIISFVIAFVVYSNKFDSDSYILDSEYLSQYSNKKEEENQNTTSASSSIGKTVEESKKNEVENKTLKQENNNVVKSSNSNAKKEIKEKDPVFKKPIEGEILKEYAKENLVYSETLKEWITHLGIDIKAEKATVVKAAAEGKVKYIKNDPRYGLTIIIEHSNGFETRYANLLTTEFVAEGEKVKVGQTIGTVGDSSIYEIVDETHLHFEILKNSKNVNPSEYIKF